MIRLFTGIWCLVSVYLTAATGTDFSKCGIGPGPESIDEAQERIIGGNDAEEGSWPWMAGIYEQIENEITYFCGGSLISTEWILTAAHCLDPESHDNVELRPHQVKVVLGSVMRYTGTENQQVLNVVEIIKHERYHRGIIPRFDYDIALFRINPVELSQHVRTICLPDSGHNNEDLLRLGEEDGNQIFPYVTGWGRTIAFHPRVPKILQELAVPLRDTMACLDVVNATQGAQHFSERMICAGYNVGDRTESGEEITDANGRDSCAGDSGGPLVRQRRSEDGSVSWYQIGIVSWGYGCAEPGQYGFYTNVLSLTHWITSNMNEPCINLSDIDNGDVSYRPSPSANQRMVQHGTEATYKCNIGYRLNGINADNRCQFGQWERRQAPACVPDFTQCGIGPGPGNIFEARGRIIGGNDAQEGSWPWMAGIYKQIDNEHAFFCGGSLISTEWILTAAHCFDPESHDDVDLQPHQIKVVLGSVVRYNRNRFSGNQQLLNVLEIITHQRYDPDVIPQFDYDLALLRLDPVELSQRVRTICLPSPDDNNEDLLTLGEGNDNRLYPYVIGWGSTHRLNQFDPTLLQQLAVPLRDTKTCLDSVNATQGAEHFSERMICAGYNVGETTQSGEIFDDTDGRDPCSVDTGGPLMRQRRSEDGTVAWYQIGIVSWGYGCAAPGQYGFYTNVLGLTRWITNKMNADESCSPRQQREVQLSGRECKDPCQADDDCRNPRRCVCDGVCGLSCINTEKKNYCIRLFTPAGSQQISSDSRMFGSETRYLCNPGLELRSGNLIRRCRGDRAWSGDQPSCLARAKSCPVPQINNAQFEGLFLFGEVVTVICNTGYTLNGLRYMSCQGDQTWSGLSRSCDITTCPALNAIANGDKRGSTYTYNSDVTYTCDDGFIIEGSERRRCQADGTWSGDPTRCRAILCDDPGIPDYGSRIGNNFGYRNVVYFECRVSDGFDLRGSASAVCTQAETWSPPVPFCHDSRLPVFKTDPGDISVNTAPGEPTAYVDWDNPEVTDNSGNYTLTYSINSGSAFGIGVTTVTVTAEDPAGNTATVQFTVTVVDNEPPRFLSAFLDVTVNTSRNQNKGRATWSTPSVFDNSGDFTLSSDHQSGDLFPYGRTLVTMRAVDPSNNQVTAEFNVNVEDVEPPVFVDPPYDVRGVIDSDSATPSSARVTWKELNIRDNVEVHNLTCSHSSGDLFPKGKTQVVCVLLDVSGNKAERKFIVTVEGRSV